MGTMDSSGSDSSRSGSSSSGRSGESDGNGAAERGAPLAVREQARAAPARKSGAPSWTFAFLSERGGLPATAAGLKIRTDAHVSLAYRVPEEVGRLAVLEGKRALAEARKMTLKVGGTVEALDCFALAMPERLLDNLVDFALGVQGSTFTTFDLVNFIRAEIGMRQSNSSSVSYLAGPHIDKVLPHAHGRVVRALRAADQPAAFKQPVDVAAPLGPNAFDPRLDEMVDVLSNHWTKTFFIEGETLVDIDDDKLHHGSPVWRAYGFAQQTSKDKKKKPVNNLVASVGGGFVLRVMPEKLGSQRAALILGAINKLVPENNLAARARLVVMQDRGYFQLAGAAGAAGAAGDGKNIIKTLQSAGVRFFGTAKESKLNAFKFVDNEDESVQGQLQLDTFGARSSFVASANMNDLGKRGNEQLVMTAVRQGDTKRRGVLIITNKHDCGESCSLAYVLEPRSGADRAGPGGVKRMAHALVPGGLATDNTRPAELAEHEHQRMMSAVYEYSREQRSADWRLARVGVFTSTGVLAVVDCGDAFFLDTVELRDLHKSCTTTACITSTSDILLSHAHDHYPCDMPATQGSKVVRVRRGTAQRGEARYWLKPKFKAADLRKECTDAKITVMDGETKRSLAEKLAGFYAKHARTGRRGSEEEEERGSEEEEEEEAAEEEEVVPEEAVVAEEEAVVAEEEAAGRTETIQAFTQLLNKVWHLKPIHTSVEGPLEIGTKAEPLALRRLAALVDRASMAKYKVERLWEHGLIGRREPAVAVTSPDAVIALLRREIDGDPYSFHGLAALELKTATTRATISVATTNTVQLGRWQECNAASSEFKDLVPNSGHRVQAMHHAAVLDVETVLMMFSSPGAADTATRFVMVSVTPTQRADWLTYLAKLATRHMPFLFSEGVPGRLPDLGQDKSPPYGYASDHHTAELHLQLARMYRQDVITNGTPPPARRLIAAQSAIWNKSMGWIDVLRKIVKSQRKHHVRDGPGLLYIGVLLDYCLLNAFRVYQFALLENKLLESWTLKELNRNRAHAVSYQLFLDILFKELTPEHLLAYYPGTEQRLAARLSRNRAGRSQAQEQPQPQPQPQEAAGPNAARKLWRFVNEAQFVEKRLKQPKHVPDRCCADGGRAQRGLCIICCTGCEQKTAHTGRTGRRTTWYCSRCLVFVCRQCWDSFHRDSIVQFAPCCKPVVRLRTRRGPDDESPGSDGDDESDKSDGPAVKHRRVEQRLSW